MIKSSKNDSYVSSGSGLATSLGNPRGTPGTADEKDDDAKAKYVTPEQLDRYLGDQERKFQRDFEIAQTKIEESKHRVTNTLAIFVALFTFVSISFGLFSNKFLTFELAFPLLLLLGCMLILFVLLLILFIGETQEKRDYLKIFMIIMSIAMICFGSYGWWSITKSNNSPRQPGVQNEPQCQIDINIQPTPSVSQVVEELPRQEIRTPTNNSSEITAPSPTYTQ